MKKNLLNSANVFISICCLDVVLPIFLPGNPINSLIHWSIIIFSIYCFFKVYIQRYGNRYLKYLSLLIAMFSLYGVLYYLFGPTYLSPATGLPMNKLSYTTAILKSLLPVYSFYYFTIIGKLREDIIQKWIIVFFAVAVVFYIHMLTTVLEAKNFTEDVTNNSGYYIVSLIPLLLFIESKKVLQYTLILSSLGLVIFSMKRGAVLSCALIMAFFVFKSLKYASFKQKFIVLFFISLVSLGLFYYISNYMMDNMYFLSRISDTLEGNTSSRDDLYGRFWKHILETDFFHQLLGSGANYTLSVSYNYAHNDWLEIGVNQGLLGVIIFFIYWVEFYKCAFRKRIPYPYNIVLGMVFIDFFVRTCFSMSYTEHTFFTNICIGYCIGFQTNNTLKKNENSILYRAHK